MARRARRACDDGGRAAGRVLAPRRHSRYLRARCGRPGADRAVRRRGRVDPPVRCGHAAEPGDARRDDDHGARADARRTGRTSPSYLPPDTLVPADRAERAAGRRQVLSGAAGAAAGVSCGADDAGGDLQVSVGDGRGRASRVDGDDGPPGVRVGRAVQRRHRARSATSSTR